MLSILISLGVLAGVCGVTLLLLGSQYPFSAALFGLLAGAACYLLLARRLGKKLEAGMELVQQALVQQRFDQAVALLEGLRRLGRWQLLLPALLDAQIGLVLYTSKDQPDRAQPYLERAPARQWQAKAMLAALHFRRKNYDKMEQVFEQVVRHNKKTGLLWSAWAWCEQRRGEQQKAVEVLARGHVHLPQDPQVQTNLLNVQNNRKVKMRGYAEEWWMLRLQRPPAQQPPLRGMMRRPKKR